MLVNNFKNLMFFGEMGVPFITVDGSEVPPAYFLQSSLTNNSRNSHQFAGAVRSFNYDTTIRSNGNINEQEKYTWDEVAAAPSGGPSNTQPDHEGANGFTLFIGTGDTAVSSSDYCLNSPIALEVQAAACTVQGEYNEKIVTSRTFRNNTEAEVTIKEVGLYIFQTKIGRSCQQPHVMIGRKVLETPVVIPVNDSYTFNYTIDMSQISFSEADS